MLRSWIGSKHNRLQRFSVRCISQYRLHKMAQLPETFDGPLEIAIIGGTGLSNLPGFNPVAQLPLTHSALSTPWGQPSSPVTVLSHPRAGGLTPLNVAFLSRHGLHHQYAPHEVPARANIAALRKLGIRCVIAFSAVGSLQEEVAPRDFLVPDQVIDRTKGIRPFTYFENGMVGHVGFANPFDEDLRTIIANSVQGKDVLKGDNAKLHDKGLLICMEGPAFSSRAESRLYKSWGGSVINMSCLPEAKLAREAELSYAMICMSTDYDSWHQTNETVSVEMVMAHMKANSENAKHVVAAILDALGNDSDQKVLDVRSGKQWAGSVKFAGAMTKTEARNPEQVAKLDWLFPGYFK